MGHEAQKKSNNIRTHDLCAHRLYRHVHKLRGGGPAVSPAGEAGSARGQRQRYKKKGKDVGRWVMSACHFSARAPVSYQFRMREPGTSLSLPVSLTTRASAAATPWTLPLPSLPVSKTQVLKREEPWVRVGKKGRGAQSALPPQHCSVYASCALPRTLARPPPSRTLGFSSSSRPAPSQVLRWQNSGTPASRSLVTLFRLIAQRLTRVNTVDGREMNAKIP